MGIHLHQELIHKNSQYWHHKPVLQQVYKGFYTLIAKNLSVLPDPQVVELGSGMGNIREVLPHCLCTDLFPNPWIDQVENAYQLSFADESISDLILTDVFHHLKYPGTALREFGRVLRPGGRVIMLEPYISALGLLVYGIPHDEPVSLWQPITWEAPDGWSPDQIDYYAAQGNATRVFFREGYRAKLAGWQHVHTIRLSALAYAASGGFSKPQLYPTGMLPLMQKLETLLDVLPGFFATRLLVILEK